MQHRARPSEQVVVASRPVARLRIVAVAVVSSLLLSAWFVWSTNERLADLERSLGGRKAVRDGQYQRIQRRLSDQDRRIAQQQRQIGQLQRRLGVTPSPASPAGPSPAPSRPARAPGTGGSSPPAPPPPATPATRAGVPGSFVPAKPKPKPGPSTTTPAAGGKPTPPPDRPGGLICLPILGCIL